MPQKMKTFMWKALSGILATKYQLRMRRVAVNEWCPVCKAEPESIFHILVQCQVAKACWEYLSLCSNSQVSTNFVQWFMGAAEMHKKEDLQLIGSICWSIWSNRFQIVWNQRGVEFVQIIESAKHIFSQWKYAQDKSFDQFLGFTTQADGNERWINPNEGRLKINVDATCFTGSNRFSFAFLARDSQGTVIEAFFSCK